MTKSITIVGLLAMLTSHAQFNGGRGDGFDGSASNNSNLAGWIGSVNALYRGAAGDGFGYAGVAAYLNGTATAAWFSGGRGDGFAVSKASFSISGADLSNLYGGGSGDGFDNKGGSFSLSGLDLVVLFSGGRGDGVDAEKYSGLVNGFAASGWYSGGAGDGFTAAQVQSYLSGIGLEALFSGGGGDGFARALYNGTLKVLPVQLISFDVEARMNYVLVKWVTAGEKDLAYYAIERSHNGALFSQLRRVSGQGNATDIRTYSITDDDPLKGRSYYRLKWTDLDGKEAYSKIRSVIFESHERSDFLVYPNPNDGQSMVIQLQGTRTNETVTVSVTDMNGKLLYQQKAQAGSQTIPLRLPKPLTKGNYVVQVVGGGETSSKLVIVQ